MVDRKTPVADLPDYEDYVLEQDLDDGA